MTNIYRHTDDMGEISGFGGEYEKCCQDMLEAGVNWLISKTNPDFQVLESHRIYGIVKLEGADAQELDDVVLKASGGEATGAMHHTVMSRLAYIAKNGWDRYCEELRKSEIEGENHD